jgi:hypothetical protein
MLCTKGTISGQLACWCRRRSRTTGRVLIRAKAEEDDSKVSLNPVELGRRSRQAIEDVWFNVTRLTSSRASFTLDDDLGADVSLGDFQTPQAEFTNVLVVGGSGRLGRVVVRKLLLRGYTVRVMCRDRSGDAESLLPATVDICRGDVSDLEACLRAATGMDKVRNAPQPFSLHS